MSRAAPSQVPDEALFVPVDDDPAPVPEEVVTSAFAPVFCGLSMVHPAVRIRMMMTVHRAAGSLRFMGYFSYIFWG
jgi:hypothetical protein